MRVIGLDLLDLGRDDRPYPSQPLELLFPVEQAE
jgi:hypothetical protein